MIFAIQLLIAVAESIGVCYGRVATGLPTEQDVVNLYKSNGIGQMRIYAPDQAVLTALRGSNIDLILGVPNSDIPALASSASSWVQNNVEAFSPDVKFKYIAVGNEIQPGDDAASFLLPAMKKVRSALATAGLDGQIKVTTVIDMGIIGNSFPPNSSIFVEGAKPYITPIVKFLADNGSPLLANVYPYFTYIADPQSVALSYALFEMPVASGYRSLFDAQVDAIYAALEKAGGGGVGIVVSESGWPSKGGTAATPGNAATYYNNLIQHVKGGTKPGAIETYLFAMFDENQKVGDETERHFGLFSPNKEPKFQLGFEGTFFRRIC